MIGEIDGVIEKTQGNKKYLFGTMTSDKIKNVTFVPVIETSKKSFLNEEEVDGYQRPGSSSRMRAFAKFLKDYPDSVVPPVLLSDRGAWEFRPETDGHGTGTLKLRGRAAVIDGQHRLGGFQALYEQEQSVRDVSFILLPGLTVEEERREFVVVNNSQKGVPKPLTAYLENDEAAQVGWMLNEDSDSLFRGRITRTTMQRPHLFALHSVAKQVKRLFSIGGVQDLPVEEKSEAVSRFWTIVADELVDEWGDIEKLDDPATRGRNDFEYKLLELTGLIAWSHTGAQILFRSYNEDSGMNWDNVTRLVKAAAGMDWRKEGRYRGMTGEYGGKIMSEDMLRLIPAENSGNEGGE